VWPRQLGFKVTPKALDASPQSAERRELRPHAVALATVMLGLLIGVANVLWGFSVQYSESPDVILVTFLWSAFNTVMLALPIIGVLRRAHHRGTYRFPVSVLAEFATASGSHL